MAHVLVVEDDRHIRDLIALHLGLEGLECSEIGDGRAALARVAETRFDLVVLDLMLPGVDGLTICTAMRRTGPNADTPVLMLTARGEESDKVLGLESGADDYLAKPFGIREFVARVRALLRRPRALTTPFAGEPAGKTVMVHGVEIDPARRRVRVQGQEVELTAQEFKLLHLLASHPGIVFSREALLARVWPDQTFVTPRSVDTLVKRLRKRVEADTESRCWSSRCGAPATSSPMSSRRWYRSLYWRIAAGFVAFLAVMLIAQGGLFLWLSTQRDEAMPPRLLADITTLVADELSDAAQRAPSSDLVALAQTRLADLGRPAVLVLADGRVVSAGVDPPAPVVDLALERLRAGDAEAWNDPVFRPGRFRGRPPGGPQGAEPSRRARFRPMPMGPPWAMAPVRVNGRAVAAVLVARGRPLESVARELAPWLTAGLVALLLGGTAVASLAVFKPAQNRLRALEDAARRFGEGDLTARAPEDGGDEVASVARAFNRMAAEAAARQAALVEADCARRQLLADVTHELRTPLTAIRGYAETLTLPGFAPTSSQGQHAVHVVDVEAQRLERLVNDLLDLARFEAGGAPLEAVAVSVDALFTRVVERHGPAAEAGGVALATTVGAGAETVRGDARRLEQVVQNLTANALRHTPAGGHVTLDARVDGGHIVLRVRDDGTGIAPEHLAHVFDRFYKADPARADVAGTGLGLSIAHAIVERHGGQMRVSSTPAVETSFEARLPV